MTWRASLCVLCLWFGSWSVVSAQAGADSAPPKGPAEIIQRTAAAQKARDAARLEQPPQPGAQAHAAADQAAESQPMAADATETEADGQPPVGDDPHSGVDGAPALARRPIALAEPTPSLPAGSVRVHVLDAKDEPAPNAEVQLGTMTQQSGRSAVAGRTDATGVYTFEKQPTGDKQAYRVNVLYQGAKYSSTPFRLPTDQGYDVAIRRLDTTTDLKELVLYVGATSIELKEERLKIVQQARLINIGSKTYVFPEKGQLIHLPKGAIAFQAEEVMTDQHMREEKGEGLRITGSVPPGEVTLTWGYDVPNTESQAELSFDLPWVTFAYRVLADAAPGLTLAVDGLPPPELHDENGRRFYVSEIVKRVGEEPLRKLHIVLKGIPGPGPQRFIAVGLALLVMGIGFFIASKKAGPRDGSSPDRALAEHKARLLARAAELEAERVRGEIGPEFHADALRELEEELAGVLYDQQRLASPAHI
jgi:hypothetical protein